MLALVQALALSLQFLKLSIKDYSKSELGVAMIKMLKLASKWGSVICRAGPLKSLLRGITKKEQDKPGRKKPFFKAL